jgi:hypothetical protein
LLGVPFPVDEAILLLVYASNASSIKETDLPCSVLFTFHQIWIRISAFALFFLIISILEKRLNLKLTGTLILA